jgi:hypothetical protein
MPSEKLLMWLARTLRYTQLANDENRKSLKQQSFRKEHFVSIVAYGVLRYNQLFKEEQQAKRFDRKINNPVCIYFI